MFTLFIFFYRSSKIVSIGDKDNSSKVYNLNINGILEKETIFLPDFELIEQFNALCHSIYHVIYANGLENEQLSLLRDSLLPKLMSGEIAVSEFDI